MSRPEDLQLSQLEGFIEQVRGLRRRGGLLADELIAAAGQLRTVGRFLPNDLVTRLNEWRDGRKQLVAEALANGQCQEFLPENAADLDLGEWEVSLQQGLEVCKRRHDQERQRRREVADLVENILDLNTSANSQPLEQAHDSARQLKSLLDADDGWQEALESPELAALESLWGLVVDARDGQIDEPESLNRAVAVNDRFGLLITLQATRGQIKPQGDWPRTYSAEEAVSKLALGQKVTTPAASPTRMEPQPSPEPDGDPFDLPALNSICERTRHRAESASRGGPGEVHPMLAACLDCLADAAEYLLEVLQATGTDHDTWNEQMREGLQAMATAQSALRRVQERRDVREDYDQKSAFNWLKRIASEHRFYIERHLRLDDLADVKDIPPLKQAIHDRLQDLKRPRRIRKILDRIQHKLNESVLGHQDNVARWSRVITDIELLLDEEHVPPSNRELREILIDDIDDLPDGLPESRGFQRVLAEIDRYLADREADAPEDVTPQYSEEVRQVANLLRGRKLVMIGGVPKPQTQAKIQEAFELGELIWERTNEHEATLKFQPIVQSPDVAAVLLLIRWVGHGHAEDIKHYCTQVRKPWIFIPRGYGINQLAHEILQQRGEELNALTPNAYAP
ncbi:MAG: hypothetical protein KDA58_07680 [Planctomycetaceae bacterium]|nr:hypothetical protein [Planctomycetaceae bacterium]